MVTHILVTLLLVTGQVALVYSETDLERVIDILNDLLSIEERADYADYADEDHARKWLDKYNREAAEENHHFALIDWAYMTNITDETAKRLENADVKLTKWNRLQQAEAKKYHKHSDQFQNATIKRMLKLISVSGSTPVVDDDDKIREMSSLDNELSTIYSTAELKKGGESYKIEPDLEQIMAKSRDYNELLWAWKGWRDVTGSRMRTLFTRLVELENEGATENGFDDIGQYWRLANYEEDNIEDMTAELLEQITPMYKKLHAYVRKKLIEQYGDKANIDPTGPIPAHLLGNMWAQNWNNIMDIATPYPETPTSDVTDTLVSKGTTPRDMFEIAEEFFTSIGLDRMTDTFWQKSMITEPEDGRDVDCHGSAEDFSTGTDFRIKMCTQVNMVDLQTIHHEMGHIEYFMQYSHQPFAFRDGANAAFHEAVGDTVALSVMTPEHLRAIHLLQDEPGSADSDTRHQQDINFLMKMALEKVPLLPFAYVVDKWRWEVFRGDINESNYNAKWWEYREKYQGVVPPVERTEKDFDPGCKYHVAANVPYIRYFLSFIAQFQFHKALCQEKNYEGPIHKCDIYESKEAGHLLAKTLSLGQSKPWPDAMETLTGQRTFDASAIIEYFKPLTDWLDGENLEPGWD